MTKVDRIELGAKISTSRKEGFASGRITHPLKGKHHSQATKDLIGAKAKAREPVRGWRHTDEARAKMSRTKAERMALGLYDSSKWTWSGKVTFSKSGEVFYRSSWEKRLFEILEADPNVLSFEVEPFFIPYLRKEGDRENLRHYVPDCLVTHVDGRRSLIEVKPKCYLEAAVNLAKFEAAREYCDAYGLTFEIWTQDRLGF